MFISLTWSVLFYQRRWLPQTLTLRPRQRLFRRPQQELRRETLGQSAPSLSIPLLEDHPMFKQVTHYLKQKKSLRQYSPFFKIH